MRTGKDFERSPGPGLRGLSDKSRTLLDTHFTKSGDEALLATRCEECDKWMCEVPPSCPACRGKKKRHQWS